MEEVALAPGGVAFRASFLLFRPACLVKLRKRDFSS